MRLRFAFYIAVVRRARQGEIVVLRHSAGDPLQFLAALLMRHRFVTVHHTLEEPELRSLTTKASRIQRLIERTLGRGVVRRASAIVAATPEIARHQQSRAGIGTKTVKPVFIYPNGVHFHDVPPGLEDARGERPELLFVADYFYPWHGLEELLRSMTHSQADGVLHVVGEVPLTCKTNDRVVYHGRLSRTAIATLQSKAWVGLSSFRLDVKGMSEACTLKVRDYLSAGLPVYAGHTDSGLPADFPFFVQGTPDWTRAVEIARSFRAIDRLEVASAARPHIDKKVLVQRLHAELVSALARPTA
ncbi:MAG: hypothetical protein ACK54C_07865 [Betaproteobacteria bacterium]